MQTPLRQLRAHVENRFGRPPLSDKQREREERIILATRTLMASFEDDHFTIGKIALALRTSPATIRRYFIDIESILAEILFRHVLDILRAIGKIPHDAPNRRELQRAAYMQATRTPWGSFTEYHLLLVLKRGSLPEDLARPIEEQRQLIGDMLAGDHAEVAFTLLDSPKLQAHQIEPMLAAHINQAADGAGSVSTDHLDTAPKPETDSPAPPAANEPNIAQPTPHPTQPDAPPPYKRHYKNWKAARRQKSLMKQAARAARANNTA